MPFITYIQKIFIPFVIALVFTACNNDIFIEENADPGNVKETIEGDGGSITFELKTKSLVSIRIVEYGYSVKYYDRNGKKLDSESANFGVLSRIECRSFLFNFDILVKGKTLVVNSISNCSDSDRIIPLRLEYLFGTRSFDISVRPGKPLELVEVNYAESIMEEGSVWEDRQLQYTNGTGFDEVLELNPYIYSGEKCIVMPEASWVQGLTIPMRVPTLSDGVWIYGTEKPVRFGQSFIISTASTSETIPIEVKKGETIKVHSRVKLEKGVSTGLVEFRNPITKENSLSMFVSTVASPVDYEIRIER